MSSLRPHRQAPSLALPHFVPIPAARRRPGACADGTVPAYAAMSEAGAVRAHNEDRWQAVPQAGLFMVADGMGGYRAGEIAAEIAVQTAAQLIPQLAPQSVGQLLCAADGASQDGAVQANPGAAGQDLRDGAIHAVLRRAHDWCNVQILACAADNPDCLGMGTTLVSCFIRTGRLHMAHVGDSRAYLLRDGSLMRLTRDHSVGEELADGGMLSDDQVRRLPGCGILTRALGVEQAVRTDCCSHDWKPSDTLLLCTDGLTDLVDDGEIRHLLIAAAAAGPCAQVKSLVAAALQAGGKDDVTALVVAGTRSTQERAARQSRAQARGSFAEARASEEKN